MVQFEQAVEQQLFVNRGFMVHVELELRDNRGGRQFGNGLVVRRAFDFRVDNRVLDGAHVACRFFGHFQICFCSVFNGRRGDTLLDGDSRNEVVLLVFFGHVPEGEPQVDDLPAELAQ